MQVLQVPEHHAVRRTHVKPMMPHQPKKAHAEHEPAPRAVVDPRPVQAAAAVESAERHAPERPQPQQMPRREQVPMQLPAMLEI